MGKRACPWLYRRVRVVGLMVAAGGCRTPAPAAPPVPVAPPAPPGMQVTKLREELQVAPWDLVFSGVRGAVDTTETVSARNLVDHVVEVRAILVVGEQSAVFRVRDLPELPARVAPKGKISAGVAFSPGADAAPGIHRAVVRFQTGPTPEDGPAVDLAALVTLGTDPDKEPPLQQVVDVLGYSVNVGAPGLQLGGGAALVGDEVAVPLFQRARDAPVAINPVARFSGDGLVQYGYYALRGRDIDERAIAELAEGQHQTLNPDLEAGGQTTFNPGEGPFGLWVKAGKGSKRKALYSEDARNGTAPVHAVRVFPLRARGGTAVSDAYLVAIDDGVGGDYQDLVFVLWNARPASPAASSAR